MNECVFKYPNTRKEEELYGREEGHGKGFILNGFFSFNVIVFHYILYTWKTIQDGEKGQRNRGGDDWQRWQPDNKKGF